MAYITTKAKQARRQKTDRDIYFENLEEAYGNLPVPSDDWADIFSVLDKVEPDGVVGAPDKEELERAIDTIYRHYDHVAKALGKEQKYG